MAKAQTAAAQVAPTVDEAALAEMRRLIFDAPIAELAESQGISVDEAVKLRVEKSIEAAPLPIEVTVRPIELGAFSRANGTSSNRAARSQLG